MYTNYLEILLKCRFWSNMSLVRAWDSEFLTNSQWSLKLLVPGPDFFSVLPSLVPQLVKDPSAVQEAWVWSLGWEDPLEKGTATHPSILAWSIPWTYSPLGRRHDGVTFTLTALRTIGLTWIHCWTWFWVVEWWVDHEVEFHSSLFSRDVLSNFTGGLYSCFFPSGRRRAAPPSRLTFLP